MPVVSGTDSKGKYYKVENVDTKYYISEYGEDEAKRKAKLQEYAIYGETNEYYDEYQGLHSDEEIDFYYELMENVLINTSNGYIEISEDAELNQARAGRVNIKMVAHEIYDKESQYNKNGLSWQEPYVSKNLESAIGMPYIVQFLDDDKTIPVGHGTLQHDEDGNAIFPDSDTVGTVQKAYTGVVEINGVEKKAMITEGYLYRQRYPNFIRWLKEQASNGQEIKGSIEINGKGNSKIIEYINGKNNSDGSLKMGRIPSVYDYSGLAILYLEEPSDDTAEMLELNKYKKKEDGDNYMDFKEMYQAEVEKNKTLEFELNSLKEDKASLEETVVNANKDIEALKEEKGKVETELNSIKEAKEKVDTELNSFKEKEAKLEVEKYFKEEVSKNGFSKEEMSELNSFVEKVDLDGLKVMEKEFALKKIKAQAEVSSQKKEEKQDVEENSIMFHTDSEQSSDKTEFNMFTIGQ